jgi:putative ATP-dependent endonuclease of the OLD family
LEEELHIRSSFWRRLTEDLGLSPKDVSEFEAALTDLNNSMIEKSEVLKHLRDNLVDMERVISRKRASMSSRLRVDFVTCQKA